MAEPVQVQHAAALQASGGERRNSTLPSSGPQLWRRDFPLLANSSVAYLDSAASAQKPARVLEALDTFYRSQYANIHRGVYTLSQEATIAYESARETVRTFLNAPSSSEVIFTHGATEGINLVASSFGEAFLRPGDELMVTVLEHHANFVPWQQLAARRGITIHYIGLNSSRQLDMDHFNRVLSPRVKLLAVTQLANALGIRPPVAEMIRACQGTGTHVLVDAAQSIAHGGVDVRALGADFVVFSGHKLYGPTGIGVLWGREALLDRMPPFLTGGDMIRTVSVRGTEWNELPAKFEAGTPHIAGAIGLAAAIDYLTGIGLEAIDREERAIVRKLESSLSDVPGVSLIAEKGTHEALVCFEVEGIHPHDVGQFLSSREVAVRAGHHCAQPLMEALGVNASTRASVGLYNTEEDIVRLAEALTAARKFFRV